MNDSCLCEPHLICIKRVAVFTLALTLVYPLGRPSHHLESHRSHFVRVVERAWRRRIDFSHHWLAEHGTERKRESERATICAWPIEALGLGRRSARAERLPDPNEATASSIRPPCLAPSTEAGRFQ